MNILEVWSGTAADRHAKRTIERLNRRVGSGRPLSNAQQLQLQDATGTAQRLTRRRFLTVLVGGAATLAVGGALFSMLEKQDKPYPIDLDNAKNDMAQWDYLSPSDKLHKLWNRNYPSVEGFNVQEELTKSCVEFYKENASTKFSPEEIVQRTVYVPTKKEYVDIALEKGMLKIHNSSITDLAREQYGNDSFGQTSPEGIVYINSEGLRDTFRLLLSINPKVREWYNFTDLESQAKTYILFHEYGHLSETTQETQFKKPVSIQFVNAELLIVGIKGLKLDVMPPDDPNVVKQIDSDEGIIDSQAYELCSLSGNDFTTRFPDNMYTQSRAIVSILNNASRVNFKILSNVISGNYPLSDLLRMWGQANLYGGQGQTSTPQIQFERGLKALGVIGALTEGWISSDTAAQTIKTIFTN